MTKTSDLSTTKPFLSNAKTNPLPKPKNRHLQTFFHPKASGPFAPKPPPRARAYGKAPTRLCPRSPTRPLPVPWPAPDRPTRPRCSSRRLSPNLLPRKEYRRRRRTRRRRAAAGAVLSCEHTGADSQLAELGNLRRYDLNYLCFWPCVSHIYTTTNHHISDRRLFPFVISGPLDLTRRKISSKGPPTPFKTTSFNLHNHFDFTKRFLFTVISATLLYTATSWFSDLSVEEMGSRRGRSSGFDHFASFYIAFSSPSLLQHRYITYVFLLRSLGFESLVHTENG